MFAHSSKLSAEKTKHSSPFVANAPRTEHCAASAIPAAVDMMLPGVTPDTLHEPASDTAEVALQAPASLGVSATPEEQGQDICRTVSVCTVMNSLGFCYGLLSAIATAVCCCIPWQLYQCRSHRRLRTRAVQRTCISNIWSKRYPCMRSWCSSCRGLCLVSPTVKAYIRQLGSLCKHEV